MLGNHMSTVTAMRAWQPEKPLCIVFCGEHVWQVTPDPALSSWR